MADEFISTQDLINGKRDLADLGGIVNGPEYPGVVQTRYGGPVKTIKRLLREIILAPPVSWINALKLAGLSLNNKGDPGGNGNLVGLLTDIPNIIVPDGTDLIFISGNTIVGDAGANRAFARAPAAVGPRVVIDKAGQKFVPAGFREQLGIFVEDFGAVGDDVTDDTDAINAAIATTFVTNVCRVLFGHKNYFCAGQILIKNPGNNQVFLNTVELVGAQYPAMIFGTIGKFPLSTAGTIIRSAAQSGSAVGVAAYPEGGYANFAINQLAVRNLTIRTYDNPKCNGLNAEFANQLVLQNVNIDTGVYSVDASEPTHNTWGLRTPARGNGALIFIENLSISGYTIGSDVNEHTNWNGGQITACLYGLEFKIADHSSSLTGLAMQRCNIVFYGNDGADHWTRINRATIEHAGADQHNDNNAWQTTQLDVRDPTNSIKGELNYTVVKGNVGPIDEFFKEGGESFFCHRIGSQTDSLSIFVAEQKLAPSGQESGLTFAATPFASDFVFGGSSDPFSIICKEGGFFSLELPIGFDPSPTGGREIIVRKNGGVVAGDTKAAVPDMITTVTAVRAVFEAVKGEKITASVRQTSGQNLLTVARDDKSKLVIRRIR